MDNEARFTDFEIESMVLDEEDTIMSIWMMLFDNCKWPNIHIKTCLTKDQTYAQKKKAERDSIAARYDNSPFNKKEKRPLMLPIPQEKG